MSASGFTPIQLYRSSTAAAVPTAGNLVAGELAINTTDEKLYFENASGVVKLLASSAFVGTVTSVAASGGTTGLTFSGSPITSSGTFTLGGTLAVANGGTGVTSSTGTVAVVLSNTPTLVTPILGAATATSVANGLGLVGTPSYTFTGDLNTGMWSPAADTVAVSTAGAERMRIDSSGNVGIGNTSPATALDVTGQITTRGAVGAFVAVSRDGSGADWSLYNPTGDDFRIFGNSADRLTITNAGNVGIGLSAPTSKLEVYGGVAGTATFATIGNATTAALFGVGTGNDVQIRTAQAVPINFYTSATERMRLDASGNVGIGTTAPQAPLDVYRAGGSSVRIDTDLNASSTQLNFATAGVSKWSMYRPGGSNDLRMFDNANVIDVMTWQAAGNVGIGTTAPTGKLAVSVASSGTFQNALVTSNGVDSDLLVRIKTSISDIYNSAGAITFSTGGSGGSERMRINTSGNVLVGTTTTPGTPNARIVAGGTADAGIQLSSSNGGGALFLSINGVAGAAFYTHTGAVGSEAYTERMRLDASGNLLVGTTTSAGRVTLGDNTGGTSGFVSIQSVAGGYSFFSNAANNGGTYYHVAFQQSSVTVGTITSSGSTTAYNTSSDYRLKNIDGPIANSGTYIDALKPVQGSWKVDGGRFIGLLAHEVQQVSETRIATGEKDGKEMQAMDYSAPEIVANLIAEVQSLRARVAQLEGK